MWGDPTFGEESLVNAGRMGLGSPSTNGARWRICVSAFGYSWLKFVDGSHGVKSSLRRGAAGQLADNGFARG